MPIYLWAPLIKGGEEMKKVEYEGFRCPEYVPAECCPERIDQPCFSSPNTCLPQERLEELEAQIMKINQILLDLSLSNEREPNEIFQRAFDGLIGQEVKVVIDCPQKKNPDKRVKRQGKVFLVGFDFVVLRNSKNREVIVPFEKIKKIKLRGRYAVPDDQEALIDIEPCLRRRLTFNFGETVSSSPELIQLFFRLRLKIYLLLLVNKRIKVRLEDQSMKGIFSNVNDETLTICIDDEKREIPIDNIFFLVVL